MVGGNKSAATRQQQRQPCLSCGTWAAMPSLTHHTITIFNACPHCTAAMYLLCLGTHHVVICCAFAGAEAGTLTFMVGGNKAAAAAATPILRHMGSHVIHCGDHGAGISAKLCNNLVLAASMAALSEALALGKRLGLDPAVLTDVSVLDHRSSKYRQMLYREQNSRCTCGCACAAPCSGGWCNAQGPLSVVASSRTAVVLGACVLTCNVKCI
jgi:hypothetical protein